MKKIVVIEDEPEMRRNLLTILKLEKFFALGAENGRAGIELVKKEKPDRVICDVMMPERDGRSHLFFSQRKARSRMFAQG
jgi:DNA-binding response OmpR family regulator